MNNPVYVPTKNASKNDRRAARARWFAAHPNEVKPDARETFQLRQRFAQVRNAS